MRKSKVIGRFIDYTFDYDGMGVYALVGKSDGKMYIGSSKHILQRLHQHEYHFSCGHATKQLQAAVNSGERFDAVILEKIPYGKNQFYLMGKEAEYIRAYDAINKGYNVSHTTCCTLVELKKSRASFEKYHTKSGDRMVDFIDGIISRRSKPIYK